MKKPTLALFITFSLLPFCARSQTTGVEWLGEWFKAWELVSKDLLSLPNAQPPAMVFYDDTYVYTTSPITAPTGRSITGPPLYGQQLPWKKMPHHDSLTLPDGQRVPVGLMSFAAPSREGLPFFVMAAPAFWKTAGIESQAFTLDKMLTGVFLHEFAHTRQYQGFGTQVDSIERTHTFSEVPLTDDIVQGYFKKDSGYIQAFRAEVNAFYAGTFTGQLHQAKDSVRKGLALLKSRQAKYFTGDKTILTKLDEIFLSMEGLGQYVAVYWLIQPHGGHVDMDAAIDGFRRKRNQWSQEEGLAMYLALTRFTKPDWRSDQFGARPKTIVELLEEAVKE